MKQTKRRFIMRMSYENPEFSTVLRNLMYNVRDLVSGFGVTVPLFRYALWLIPLCALSTQVRSDVFIDQVQNRMDAIHVPEYVFDGYKISEPKLWVCPDNGDFSYSPASSEILNGSAGANWGDQWGRQNYLFGGWSEQLRREIKGAKTSTNMRFHNYNNEFYAYGDQHKTYSQSGYDILIPAGKDYAADEIRAIAEGMLGDTVGMYRRSPYHLGEVSYYINDRRQWANYQVNTRWCKKGTGNRQCLQLSAPSGDVSFQDPIQGRLFFLDTVGTRYLAKAIPLAEKVTCTSKRDMRWSDYPSLLSNQSMILHQVEVVLLYKLPESSYEEWEQVSRPLFRAAGVFLKTYVDPDFGKSDTGPQL